MLLQVLLNFPVKINVRVLVLQLTTLRCCVLEDAIPSSSRLSANRGLPNKDVLESVAPELQMSALRLATSGNKTTDQLLKLDEQGVSTHNSRVHEIYLSLQSFTGHFDFSSYISLYNVQISNFSLDIYSICQTFSLIYPSRTFCQLKSSPFAGHFLYLSIFR